MSHGFKGVVKRELAYYFSTPLAYVILFIFLFSAAILTFKERFFQICQADLRLFFDSLPVLFIFIVPAIGMRLISEERKSGTIELLLSFPVTVRAVVLGKYIAAWLFLAVGLILSFPVVITVNYLGNPDNIVILVGYAGAFLLAGCYLSISIFSSAITKNQVISFILSVSICAIFAFADYPSVLNILRLFLPMGLIEAFENMSFINHYESMRRGVIELRDFVYYIFFISGWITAAGIVLNERMGSR